MIAKIITHIPTAFPDKKKISETKIALDLKKKKKYL